MKNLILCVIALAVLNGCGSNKKVAPTVESSYWRKDSEKMFRIFCKYLASYNPEMATFLGAKKYESGTTPYSKNYEKFRYATAYRLKKKFEKYALEQKNQELRLDAKLIEEYLDTEILDVETAREVGVVPFVPATKFIRDNITGLLSAKDTKTINNGMARFRSYVRGNDKQMPFILGFTAHMVSRMEQLEQKRMRGFWPTQGEIKDYILNSDEYLKDIEKILSVWKTDEWRRDLEALKEQEKDFKFFLEKKVLPYARKTHVLHPKVYANQLKSNSILTNPSELIDVAKEDYRKTYLEFKKQAVVVSKAMKLSTTSPVNVLNILKSLRLRNSDELSQYYKDSILRLSEIVRKNEILTLDEIPPHTVREARGSELGYLNPVVVRTVPFSLKRITPEIVFVNGDPKDNSFDSAHKESITNFIARQVLPGAVLKYFYHDAMNPSSIRAIFSESFHNSEGWSHYAEDLVYPYLNDEEKLVFLQRKLLRQARTFLDAEYHLGRISSEKVKDIYFHELGFSDQTFNFELNIIRRYPGYIPSSYHGYLLLLNIKKELVKGKVTEKCFNDYLVRAGVIPFDELNIRLRENLFCGDQQIN